MPKFDELRLGRLCGYCSARDATTSFCRWGFLQGILEPCLPSAPYGAEGQYPNFTKIYTLEEVQALREKEVANANKQA